MAIVRPWVAGICLGLAAASGLFAASSEENRAFQAAAQWLDGTFFDKAEAEFAAFAQKFTNSTRLPEAILCQAEARFYQTNYPGAIELLSSHLNVAGSWADQYLFWLGESQFRQGALRAAVDSFAKLVKDFPNSSRRLEAGVKQATVLARLSDWPGVIDSLQQTNGVFQETARTNAASEWVFRGSLLLSEAHLSQKNYSAAETTLRSFDKLLLTPTNSWQRQYLLCRIQLAGGRPEEALQSTTNLLTLAANTAQTALLAESVEFRARILEGLGRIDEAIAAYTNNLAEAIPAERQRTALFKSTQLFVAQKKIPEAAQMLEKFLARYPKAASADLAWLTLGELRLRAHMTGPETNRPDNATATTNFLELARIAFETLIREFPQSPFLGKGQLDLGWCFWLTNKWAESQKAFQSAVERLPASADQALAYFKLGDSQFQQRDFAGAITNYRVVIQKFGTLPEVQTNLLERALYQSVRAGLDGGDVPAATNALRNILTLFPDGFHTDRAVLLTGQQIALKGDPAAARAIYSDFLKMAPADPLRPELELAIARTYEQEEQWTAAIQEYDGWLARFTNHDARPRAAYFRARASYQAHDETNALSLFTNFVAQFPTNEFAPQARWWVADHYFRSGDPIEAEKNYQLLSLNWPASELAYPARLMAGHAALARQSWKDAEDYFFKLYKDTNCPADLRFQALFAYGGSLMSQNSTNRLADYEEAIGVFGTICDYYPTNALAVLAWGEKANCLLQWAQYSHQYASATNASFAFQKVIDSPQADARARSIAKFGQAVVLEKQAEQKSGSEQVALLREAYTNCLHVFYGTILRDGEKPDLFWTKKAGLEAIALAEQLKEWLQVQRLGQQLQEKLPPLRASLEKRILKAQENLNSVRN